MEGKASELLRGGIEKSAAAVKLALSWRESSCKQYALASLNKQTNTQTQELHREI